MFYDLSYIVLVTLFLNVLRYMKKKQSKYSPKIIDDTICFKKWYPFTKRRIFQNGEQFMNHLCYDRFYFQFLRPFKTTKFIAHRITSVIIFKTLLHCGKKKIVLKT